MRIKILIPIVDMTDLYVFYAPVYHVESSLIEPDEMNTVHKTV